MVLLLLMQVWVIIMSPLTGTLFCQGRIRLKIKKLWKYSVHLIYFKDFCSSFSNDWHRSFFHISKFIPRNVFFTAKSVIITSFLSVKNNDEIWLFLCFYFYGDFFISLCYSDVSRNFKEKQKFAIENKIPMLSGNPCFKHQERMHKNKMSIFGAIQNSVEQGIEKPELV